MSQAITGNNSLQKTSKRKLTPLLFIVFRLNTASNASFLKQIWMCVLASLLISFSLTGCFESHPESESEPSPPQAPEVSRAESQEPELTPLQRYLDVSQMRISLKTMHDRYFLGHFKLESQKPNLPPSLVAPVRNYIIESVHGTSLLDRFIGALKPYVHERELQQMNQWLTSPLGAKVNALEMGEFIDPNFAPPRLKHSTLPPERQKLIAEYVDLNQLVNISVNVLRLIKMSVLQGMQSVTSNTNPIQAPSVTENDRLYARAQLLDHYSSLFRTLTNAELMQLIQIAKAPTYQKIHLATNRALLLTFEISARDIGRIIGQGMRQIQTEENAASQAQQQNEPPPSPPKIKKHVELLRQSSPEENKDRHQKPKH
ncbi:MAG: hypothetical protein P8176_03935 [Gammaproteobacteria bacterium]